LQEKFSHWKLAGLAPGSVSEICAWREKWRPISGLEYEAHAGNFKKCAGVFYFSENIS